MWETIKNDPILRTVTIIILSVLGFGFAFNIMFGARNGAGMGMVGGEGMMSSGGGYSLGNTLSYIFMLSLKILLIALVIFALVALFKFASKHLFEGREIKMIDSIKNDPVLKTSAIIIVTLLTLGLISVLFGGILGTGNNYSMNGNEMMKAANGYNMVGSGTYGSASLSGILTGLLNILLVLSVIGLIIGLVMFVYQNYSQNIVNKLHTLSSQPAASNTCVNCGSNIADNFVFCPACGAKTKQECFSCGTELKTEWKCCPSCGTDRNEPETPNA